MRRYLGFLAILLSACLFLAGCTSVSKKNASRWASITGHRIEKAEAGEEFLFHVLVEQDMIENHTPVNIQTSGLVDSGYLQIVLRAPDGSVVWNGGRIGPGDFSINTSYYPEQTGEYALGAVWDGPVAATYNLGWQGFTLTPMILVPGIGMVLVALGFVIFGLRAGSGWKYIWLGALAWAVTVAVKFAIAIPLNPIVTQALYTPGTLWTPGDILFYLYIGAMTGVTEVLLTWLLIRYTRLGKSPWRNALGFGIGFGAFEAILLGFLSLFSSISALIMPSAVMSAMGSLAQTTDLLFSLAPVSERFGTILVHIFCNVLLFYGAMKLQSRWFWLSFGYKTLLDSVAGFAQVWGIETLGKIWTIEAIILLFGLLAWYWMARIRKVYPDDESPQESIVEIQPAT